MREQRNVTSGVTKEVYAIHVRRGVSETCTCGREGFSCLRFAIVVIKLVHTLEFARKRRVFGERVRPVRTYATSATESFATLVRRNCFFHRKSTNRSANCIGSRCPRRAHSVPRQKSRRDTRSLRGFAISPFGAFGGPRTLLKPSNNRHSPDRAPIRPEYATK
ncbi:hypothetical protein U1Q18_051567, partial [Sarracenia purpurea var. burkii]